MKKIFIPILLILAVVGFGTFRYFSGDTVEAIGNIESTNPPLVLNTDNITTRNRASILINLDTNQVLFENNIHQSIGVYSVSKVMFLATVENYLQKSHRSLDEVIEVTEAIDRVNSQANFSSAGLRSGQKFTIRELYDAVIMPSGNDACVLLGDALFGSQFAAVQAMNDLAKEWGMSNSSFISTSGLDGQYLQQVGIQANDGKNMMSVYDIVTLVQNVKNKFPEIFESSKKTVSIIGVAQGNPITLGNVNGVVEGNPNSIPGVFGLKTGSNIVQGSNAIAAVRHDRNGQTLLAVSLASQTRASLYQDVANMFSYADSLEMINLQDQINLNVEAGFVTNQVDFTLERPFFLYTNPHQELKFILDNPQHFNPHLNIFNVYNKGEVVGELKFLDDSHFLNNQALNIPRVVVANQPERMGMVSTARTFVSKLINN